MWPASLSRVQEGWHAALVPVLGGADEVVVADVERLQHRLPVLGDQPVGPLLRGDAGALRRPQDLLAVLVGAGQEPHVLAPLPVPPADRVGGDRRVRVPDVWGVIDVVDGRGDVERLAGRAHGAILVARRQPPVAGPTARRVLGTDRALGGSGTSGSGWPHASRTPVGQRTRAAAAPDPPGVGTLVLAGTPLGNPGDASPRLAALLAAADLVAAEDTRRLRRLLADLGVRRDGPVVSFYDDVERARLPALLDVLDAGRHRGPGHRRGDAVGVRSRLPRGAGRGGRRSPGHVAARALGGHDRPGGLGPALRPVLLRGVPAAQGGRAARRGSPSWPRATHAGVLRVPAPAGGHADRPGRGVRLRTPAAVCRELSKTYEEVGAERSPSWPTWARRGARGDHAGRRRGAAGVAPTAGAAALAAPVAGLIEQGVDRKEALRSWREPAPRRVVYDAVVPRRSARRRGVEPPAQVDAAVARRHHDAGG